MTNQEIDAIPAGRELDALVAEKVMGCKVVKGYGGAPVCGCGQTSNYPHSDPDRDSQLFGTLSFYSTDIAAAWAVAEKSDLTQLQKVVWDNERRWTWNAFCGDLSNSEDGDAFADTAPLAICRAALKAVLSK